MSETIYKYEIRIANQAGIEIKTLVSFSHLKLARVVNGIGTLEILVPSWAEYELFKPDSRIAVYRSVAGEPLKLVGETIFIVTGRKRIRKNKQKFILVYGRDANKLLDRRIVAYKAGSAQAQKTDSIDDMMKEIVRENLSSSATDTDRRISVLSVASDTSSAPAISKAFSNKNVLSTLQELAQASYSSGTYLAFDLFAYDVNSFQFRTYPNVRGVDRTYAPNSVPVIIDADLNMGEFELFEDYENSIAVIYAGGQGEGSAREIVTAIDSSRIYSNISRTEKFVDGRNTATTALLTSEANTALRNYRPKKTFVAEFIQTENLLFGRDINFGDLVCVQVENIILDCRIDAFSLALDETGQEIVTIILRSDN